MHVRIVISKDRQVEEGTPAAAGRGLKRRGKIRACERQRGWERGWGGGWRETAMVQRLAWWGGQQCRELMDQRREES